MTIGVSIVHFVIKVPKLVQMMLPYIEYRLIKYQLLIQDGRQKSKRAATNFFDISTSDRGDFPRIIEIALFTFKFVSIWFSKFQRNNYKHAFKTKQGTLTSVRDINLLSSSTFHHR